MALSCPVRFWQDAVVDSSTKLCQFHAVLQDIRPSYLFTYISLGELTKEQLNNIIPSSTITHLTLRVCLSSRYQDVPTFMSGLLKNLRNMPLVLLILELDYKKSSGVRSLWNSAGFQITIPVNSHDPIDEWLETMDAAEFAAQLLQNSPTLEHILIFFSLDQQPDAVWRVERDGSGSASLGERLDDRAKIEILSNSPFRANVTALRD